MFHIIGQLSALIWFLMIPVWIGCLVNAIFFNCTLQGWGLFVMAFGVSMATKAVARGYMYAMRARAAINAVDMLDK